MCGHKECSILHSTTPSILQKFQNENTPHHLTINDSICQLCFPLGIKLCYRCKLKTKDNKNYYPKIYSPFMNIIKNEKGDKFYMVSLFYFRNVNISFLEEKFKFQPIKLYNQEINEISLFLKNDEIEENFKIMSNFVMSDNVLIPECVSLISRFPYISQMEICLKNIIAISKHETNAIIAHVVNEILVPKINTEISFFLPRTEYPIELISPYNKKETLSEVDFCLLFEYFNPSKIVKIFQLILLEKKVLFLSDNYRALSLISFIFINLISPFKWSGTYIPVLSIYTIRFLQSFMPFVMGIDSYLYKRAKDEKFIRENDEIYIVPVSKTLQMKFKLPEFPSKIESLLLSELKQCYSIFLQENKKDDKKTDKKDEKKENKPETLKDDSYKKNINEKIKKVFFKAMVSFIGEYKRFVYYSQYEDVPLFDELGFISLYQKKLGKDGIESNFIKEICSTQNFLQFLSTRRKYFFDNEEYLNKEMESFNNSEEIQKIKIRSASLNKQKKRPNSSFRNKKNESDFNANTGNLGLFNTSTGFGKNITEGGMSYIMPNDSVNYSTLSVHKKNSTNNFNMTSSNFRKLEKCHSYILFPYFLRDKGIMNEINQNSISSYINKSIADANTYDVMKEGEHYYILPYSSTKFKFSSIKSSNKKYVIQSDIFGEKKGTSEFNVNEINDNESRFDNDISNLDIQIDEKEKKAFIKIFKDVFLKKISKTTMEERTFFSNYLNSDNLFKVYILNFFVYKEKMYTKDLYKQISDYSFDFLYKLIQINLDEHFYKTNGNEELCKGFTIMAFIYFKNIYTKKGSISYFIYEKLLEDKQYCSLWYKESFWKYCVNEELSFSSCNSDEDYDFQCIKNMLNIMKKLGLEQAFIRKALDEEFVYGILQSEEKMEEYEKILFTIEDDD